MSFRKTDNRRESWQRFVAARADCISATGLPAGLFRSEEKLVNLLYTGECQDPHVKLDVISNDQFKELEKIVNAYFKDGWHQDSMAAFSKQRLERFGRYA